MKPIDMILHCPKCGAQHIDKPDDLPYAHVGADFQKRCDETWDNPPHRSHLCKACGCIWRPADVCTNGVKAITTRGHRDTWSPAKR